MEIKKTTVSAKPQGLTLSDGTWLSPRERTEIRQLYRTKNWKMGALCSHYSISQEDMAKITGSTTESYGKSK